MDGEHGRSKRLRALHSSGSGLYWRVVNGVSPQLAAALAGRERSERELGARGMLLGDVRRRGGKILLCDVLRLPLSQVAVAAGQRAIRPQLKRSGVR